MRRRIGESLLLAGLLTCMATSASAQARGSIFGKVTDESGGVLPGVTVTVAGTGLQQPLVAVTTSTGAYEFPSVPIGTYSVLFEMSGFKKAARENVIITSGFNAGIDQKLSLGALTEEVTVSGASPIVDLKKTSTGSVFTADVLEKIPTARDPWQIIGMTPGVRAGLNVGGSASGQQVGLNSRGTAANVQWNLEGGSITDLSSNSSPSYYNFDSLEQIQVTNGGGDVSVQSSGLAINLITKSGSNVFKGSAMTTFENDKMQSSNVTEELFNAGANGFLSGAPIQKIANYSIEYRRPDYQGSALVLGFGRLPGHQYWRRQFFRRQQGAVLRGSGGGTEGAVALGRDYLRQPRSGEGLPEQRQDDDQEPALEDQLPAQLVEQAPVPVPERQQIPQPPRRKLDQRR